MLAVTGYRSQIVAELRGLLPTWEIVERIPDAGLAPAAERYLLCAGVLRPKRLSEQTSAEINESLYVNLIRPIELCEDILSHNEAARIVVIGSESGYTGSFDEAYAAAKAGLHKYIETRKLKPGQQLVGIAPSIIADCGMTMRRLDQENLEARRLSHPKRRFLKAVEVAKLVHFVLYEDAGYLSGQVIRLNGGV